MRLQRTDREGDKGGRRENAERLKAKAVWRGILLRSMETNQRVGESGGASAGTFQVLRERERESENENEGAEKKQIKAND